jgi:hypothetical protein
VGAARQASEGRVLSGCAEGPNQLMRTIWVVSAVIRKAMEAATVRIHPSRDGARRSVSCSEADMAFKVEEK